TSGRARKYPLRGGRAERVGHGTSIAASRRQIVGVRLALDQIGPYKVVRRINSEGTGELYEAIHEQIQRRASIKVLHKELAEDREAITRFLNEAKAVNLISHPSIVNIYEQGQLPSGAPYIVMEYLEGETLRDRLR